MKATAIALAAVLALESGPVAPLAQPLWTGAAPDSAAAAPDAAPSDTTAAAPAESALERARASLREGDYDRSIEVLKQALVAAHGDPARLREVYLLLVKTYVFLGNDLKFKPQGREASSLNYQEARRLIAECLATPALRHLRPEPASEYPPEMLGFFAEARRRMFGSYRVLEITPPAAVVLLDGDTLRAAPGDSTLGDVDIPVGPHLVQVRARGYKDATDRITIGPDVTLERSYRLAKRHGPLWYATRGVGALGLLGGVIAASGGGGSSGATAQPLPGAPDPPTR